MTDSDKKISEADLIALGSRTAEVAHELRNLMTAILAGAEKLSENADADVASAGTRIRDNARACRVFVNKLLTGSESVKSTLDLQALLARIIDGRGGVATISLDSDSNGSPAIYGNDAELISVFENLFRNAEEAGDSGVTIRIKISQPDDHLVVTVADDGPGVPLSIRDSLFEEFQTKGKQEGTGIGLALAKRIVEDHGGSIALLPQASKGATFELNLPAAPETVTADVSTDSIPIETDQLAILCVDDDQSTLDTYEMILSLDGHKITTAATGTEGLAHFRRRHFDVVLCDLRLPDMTGMDFHRRLAELAPETAECLVFATGDLMNDSSAAYLANSRCPYLIKPFEIEQLRVAIRVALKGNTP